MINPETGIANPSVYSGTEYYELRVYICADAQQLQLVQDYYEIAIPALNRLRVNNVGVFTTLEPSAPAKLYVFIPYNSLQHFADVNAGLENDAAYQRNAETYLNAPAASPAYERIESSLMQAFKNFPEMAVPEKKERIFELRQYQSPTESAGKKKIEMFNDQGEIDIFKRLQFNPVFWGETIIGAERPNLTYMVTFENLEAKDAYWETFIADPQWKEISTVPGYSNELLINLITSTVLLPTKSSQL